MALFSQVEVSLNVEEIEVSDHYLSKITCCFHSQHFSCSRVRHDRDHPIFAKLPGGVGATIQKGLITNPQPPIA